MKPTTPPLSAKLQRHQQRLPLAVPCSTVSPVWQAVAWLSATLIIPLALLGTARAADPLGPASPARFPSPPRPAAAQAAVNTGSSSAAPASKTPASGASAAAAEKPLSIADQVRAAVEQINNMPPPRKPRHSPTNPVPRPPEMSVSQTEASVSAGKPEPKRTTTSAKAANLQPKPVSAQATSPDASQQQYLRARAAALGSFANTTGAAASVGQRSATPAMQGHKQETPPELPWSYSGAAGPQAWGKLKPEFATCGNGLRQSPIAIDDTTSLSGPAEPLTLDYKASNGSVLHTGRTIQVDVQGDNFLTVRGTRYRLTRMEFHQPAEEIINGKTFAMGVHLLHRSEDGQQAMLAVLLEPGETSPLVDQVWTYLPLDVTDRVTLPAGGINVASLVPQDQRYYQFFGSLTAPPCTEGVLWMVMRKPMTLSASQLRLFTQLFPNNARPVQPVNDRVVRAAQ